MGYYGKLSVVRERDLTAVRAGKKKKGSVLENQVNIIGLSLNKNECSVASCISFFLEIHLYLPLTNGSVCV